MNSKKDFLFIFFKSSLGSKSSFFFLFFFFFKKKNDCYQKVSRKLLNYTFKGNSNEDLRTLHLHERSGQIKVWFNSLRKLR